MPALKKIDDHRASQNIDSDDSTAGLNGLSAAWKQTADTDSKFRQAQDEVVNEVYLNPAIKRAEAANVHSAVGQLIIFDTILQHGEGDDKDGLPHIMQEALQKFPRAKFTEKAWLEHFLQVRKKHLLHAADPSTRQDWIESVDRVRALKSILDSGNSDLSKVMSWTVYGDPFSLPATK